MDIDIGKHNIIEASAGTGKTYTIENLILKILIETHSDLNDILIVTYTEKATGELRERIRLRIESSLDTPTLSKVHDKLKHNLKNFENASIHTIHGFCNRILKEYSFETNQTLRNDIVDDYEIYMKSLKNIMRNRWKNKYKDNLFDILTISNYPDINKIDQSSDFENKAVSIALNFNPEKDIILPEKIEDFVDYINNFKNELRELMSEVRISSGFIDDENLKNSSIYKKYDENHDLNNNGNYKRDKNGRLEKIIIPILTMTSYCNNATCCNTPCDKAPCNNQNILKYYFDFIDSLEKWETFSKNGNFDSLITYRGKKIESLIEEIEGLENIIEIFEKLRKKYDLSTIRNQLLRETIYDLKSESKEYKREKSLISYSDMLNLLNEALLNNDLLNILQKRYKYGIVDEFQDTDPVQYDIFKKIFMEGESNKLFIIGDPKQAIYGFRGADIYTYFKAREDMLRYNTLCCLDENYRSCKEIVSDFNQIFRNKWFDNQFIVYNDVKYPDRPEKDEPKINYGRKEYSTTIIKNRDDKIAKVKYDTAFFIANEITRLLSNNIEYTLKNKTKKLSMNDFCILVGTKKDADIIEEELDKLNLKHTFYKKPGLYQSAEAQNIYFLLKAISEKENEGFFLESLLTDFFGIDVDNLIDKQNLSVNFYDIFLRWRNYAENKEYNKLFRSIINDTGIYFKLIHNTDSDRIITNYNHIFQNLLIESDRNDLSIKQIVTLLKNFIEKNVNISEIDDLHKLETEDERIKILTIHASKGLEFPIVFIFAGFNLKKNNFDYYKIHKNDKTFYDITKHEENKTLQTKEIELEQQRLYYVAFTRAIFKLYIPLIEHKKESLNFMQSSLSDLNGENIKYVYCDEISEPLSQKDHTVKMNTNEIYNYDIPHNLFENLDKNILNRKTTLLSFSRLQRETDFIKNFGDKSNYERDEDDIGDMKTQLPGGTMIGNMFHKILEKIDYSQFEEISSFDKIKDNTSLNKIILENIENYLIKYEKRSKTKYESYKNDVYKIIFNTITTTINEKGFRLSNLKKSDRLNEVEFYYPLPHRPNFTIENVQYKEGFLYGYIDMIFRYENKYYIIDWKSNICTTFSGQDFIKNVENEYKLQYRLYTIALLRFLRNNLRDFDYDKHFGGVYYIYLRGKTSNSFDGVFYDRKESDPTVSYENNLLELIKIN